MQLPIFHSDSRESMMMQSRWSTLINPILNQPLNAGNILTGIDLISGVTVVNHLLGRQMQGWFIVDQDAVASIYRSAAMNDLTLTLTSSAAVTVNIFVF